MGIGLEVGIWDPGSACITLILIKSCKTRSNPEHFVAVVSELYCLLYDMHKGILCIFNGDKFLIT